MVYTSATLSVVQEWWWKILPKNKPNEIQVIVSYDIFKDFKLASSSVLEEQSTKDMSVVRIHPSQIIVMMYV